MTTGREPFEVRRRLLYDKVRRATLSSPNSFDGPRAAYKPAAYLTIEPGMFEESRSTADEDAFYEAIHDLQSEGFVTVRNGEIALERRHQRSDRGVDAPLDHARAGRGERESAIRTAAGEVNPRMVGLERLPPPLEHCIDHEQFAGLDTVVLYNRKIHVRASATEIEETWALTYSAIRRGSIADLGDFVSLGVFGALKKNGVHPSHRKESLLVRFPYTDERTLLGFSDDLWRLPVIVAVGSVFATERGQEQPLCVEQYVNIMRADRYIIQSELNIHE